MKYEGLLQKLVEQQMGIINDLEPSKEMLLEYFKGDPIINPKFQNTKDPNRAHMRKHVNTKPFEHGFMSNDVENVAKGRADNILLTGARLQNILTAYNITFKPGTKGLGRSRAVLVMYNTPQGPAAVIKHK